MGDTLDELQRLQKVELKLAAIRRAREAKVRRLDANGRRARQIEAKLSASRDTIRERQGKVDALTLDVSAREEAINKHRQALTHAKTNKEYAAILTAMNTEKADNAKIEALIFEQMEQVQALRAERKEIEAEQAKLLGETLAAEEGLRKFDSESGKEEDECRARWDALAEHIPSDALRLFRRASQRHDGEALAFIEKSHPKRDEYLCSGCNMNLTLEVLNALHTRDDIQLCNACGRVLCLEPGASLK